jgi:hypothetical protein
LDGVSPFSSGFVFSIDRNSRSPSLVSKAIGSRAIGTVTVNVRDMEDSRDMQGFVSRDIHLGK